MDNIRQIHQLSFPGHSAKHQPGAPILEALGLSVSYQNGLALDDVSFRLNTGERVAVVGPNGAGKSTLFKVIAGVLSPTRGEVKVYGSGPGGHICIAYLPQRSQVDWTFPVNVTDVVMMGRIGKLGILRWPGRRDWSFVQQLPGRCRIGRPGEEADRRAFRWSTAAHVHRSRPGTRGRADADGRAFDRLGYPITGDNP